METKKNNIDSYLDQELVDKAYEATIFNLALGVDVKALSEVQYDSAMEDDFETAQGVSLGILAWELSGNFNCNLKNELYE
jgi:hypothetical protein|tara:strand:+ start:1706 stop:1945 length:240 start_codon:yes stop_codon:yes gene_type:complete